ncbi:MAG TPA: hypothetical protein VM243_02685 [Phycisphaerae bacterium]|nr:hypothetical protein [Phycisphaerae bacterium]
MIGPRKVENVVLCTGPAGAALCRYGAARLTCEVPGARVHVFFQRGPGRFTQRVTAAPALKRWYWSLAHRWGRWGTGRWRRQYGRWMRELDGLLARATPGGVEFPGAHCVDSVNGHAARVREIAPDVLLIFGGRKVDAAVLDSAGVALNIHCGRLPAYRGVKSALFALANDEPEQVGVTLHVAEAAIDAGPIVRWQSVAPQRAASIPELFLSLYRTGWDVAVDAIKRLAEVGLETGAQVGAARMYRVGDLDARVLRSASSNFRKLREQAVSSAESASLCLQLPARP